VNVFKTMSLKNKLIITIFVSIVLIVVFLELNLIRALNSMKFDVVNQTSAVMEKQIEARLKSEASTFGEEISSFINSAYQLPTSVAKILEDSMAEGNIPFDRDQVNQLVASVLLKNQQVSSMYAQFERNAYDQMDAMFINSGSMHSVQNSGALEIYWVRLDNGQIEQQQVEDSSEKYADAKDEFGIRESEWYLCAWIILYLVRWSLICMRFRKGIPK